MDLLDKYIKLTNESDSNKFPKDNKFDLFNSNKT